MRPAEEWTTTFCEFFSDEEVVRMSYAISLFSGGTYCKLCDAWIEDAPSDHMEAHARDLERWRSERRAAQASERAERMARLKEERALERAVVGTSDLDRKQLMSRVRNARWRLGHPERYKRDSWTKAECEEMEKVIAEATKTLRTKETA